MEPAPIDVRRRKVVTKMPVYGPTKPVQEENQSMTLIKKEPVEEKTEEKVVELEKGSSWWRRTLMGKNGDNKSEPQRHLTPLDIGIREDSHTFLVNKYGEVSPIEGNYYPHGTEYLVTEIEIDNNPRNNEWIFHRKVLNPLTGKDEITEHFRVTVSQMRKFLIYDRDE